jgi:acyl-CoA synthetase (AMP-forming)/AMP-acid ligase II
VRRAHATDLAGLDLSSWRVAINGAEPVRKESLDRFTEVFGPRGFRAEVHRPVYGLAEATLMVTCDTARVAARALTVGRDALEQGRIEAAAAGAEHRTLVSCGRPIAGSTLEIVDPETRSRCAPGVVGEIWLAGPSIAGGYWRKPAETEEVFGARLASGEGPFLRTGDMGFVDDGELFIAGRRKDLIIVRGKNYYPQDIEAAAVRSHPAVRPGSCVAFGIDDDEAGEGVVVVAEADLARALPSLDDVSARIRDEVRGDVGLEVHNVVLIRRGTLPKTSSGKVQRFRCKADYLAGQLARVA